MVELGKSYGSAERKRTDPMLQRVIFRTMEAPGGRGGGGGEFVYRRALLPCAFLDVLAELENKHWPNMRTASHVAPCTLLHVIRNRDPYLITFGPSYTKREQACSFTVKLSKATKRDALPFPL